MSNAVMISIHPEWCEKIISGQKTIEIRKTRPKIETPFKCYIYCTQDNKNDLIIKNHKGYLFGKISDRAKSNLTESWIANGQVIGEFICRDIEPITPLWLPVYTLCYPENVQDEFNNKKRLVS